MTRNIKSKLPQLQANLHLYLANRDTEFILLKPVRGSVTSSYSRLAKILSTEHYTQEDVLIASCPSVDQITAIMNAILEEKNEKGSSSGGARVIAAEDSSRGDCNDNGISSSTAEEGSSTSVPVNSSSVSTFVTDTTHPATTVGSSPSSFPSVGTSTVGAFTSISHSNIAVSSVVLNPSKHVFTVNNNNNSDTSPVAASSVINGSFSASTLPKNVKEPDTSVSTHPAIVSANTVARPAVTTTSTGAYFGSTGTTSNVPTRAYTPPSSITTTPPHSAITTSHSTNTSLPHLPSGAVR